MIRILSVLALSLLFSPGTLFAATLYLDSANEYAKGETFVLPIRLSTEDECINAVQVTLSYPESMQAVDFGKGNSILTLWVEEPKIDTTRRVVTFSGGVPGGYCGRVPGDPALTNVLGKVVFTALSEDQNATVTIAPSSALYVNDGLGTKLSPDVQNAQFSIVAATSSKENPWIREVTNDAVPPDPFEVIVESTRGVFGGKYFAVFATVDKQSGLDHYEIFERGGWSTVTSPHKLSNQSLEGGVVVRAIDKAGNERLGTYKEGSAPPRQHEPSDFMALYVVLALLILSWIAKRYLDSRKKVEQP
jgi:hypothetical protein